jgi:hypothetical protein
VQIRKVEILMKRQDVVTLLRQLLPLMQRGEARYKEFSNHTMDTFWKALFISYWQKYGQCTAELEYKIRVHGGDLDHAEAKSSSTLINHLNLEEEFSALEAYKSTLAQPTLPLDVNMLFQRHILVLEDIVKRLESLPREFTPTAA